ncbi:MAG: alpha/beta fold hydrolase [Chitinophagaceae bacterium]|nr:alpha/beta fold hydrolase [Chitinophagaceae bacterium]MCW5929082.1 alpha/beta fold hydrolase [Chitinophagaceae bacterium]
MSTSKYPSAILKCFFISLVLIFNCLQPKGQDRQNRVMQYRTADGQYKKVKTKSDWKIKKAQVLQAMQEVMGTLPVRPVPAPGITYIDTFDTDAYTRYTVHLDVEENETLPALLYLPKTKPPSGKYPAMLALHSTGAKGKQLVDSFSAGPYRAIATELVHCGYIVLAPDYPGFGDLSNHDFENDRYESGTMQGIFNHIRCIDYLQSRDDVNKDNIGVIGHSLGGHNAIFMAAFDERVKVVVSSCGWTLMDHYDAGVSVTERFGGKLGPWAQDRYMPFVRTKYNLDAALLPFDFDEIIAAIAPRHFFSNSPMGDENFNVEGVRKGIGNAQQAYKLNRAADRINAYYPDAGHDFPETIKTAAYELLDKVLK